MASSKISSLPVLTAVDGADEIPINDVSAGTTKRTTVSSLLAFFFPVGSLYSNGAVSTNPSTFFGFGTWTPYAVGKSVVGINSADTDFNTLGASGGEKRHTLSWDEMPAHNHGVNDGGHAHSFNLPTLVANGGPGLAYPGNGNTWHYQDGGYGTNGSGSNISIQNAGSGQSANNLSPYQVAAVWERTA